jgi:hypothetical protein
MINKNWIIIALAVIVAALIAGFWWYDHNKLKKQSVEWQTLYRTCQNAPADTIKMKDSIVYRDTTIFKPYPVKVEIHDSVFRQERISWYDSVYKKDGWRIHYKLRTQGSLDYIEFSDLVAPKEIITITRKIDTCINQVITQPVFRIGPYVGLALNSFNKFPGLGAGIQLVIKDQLSVSVGGLYLDNIYVTVRFGILFK